MNMGKEITDLREGTTISGKSMYIVEMGDGTGTKRITHEKLVNQIQKEIEMSYEETLELLNKANESDNEENIESEVV